MQVESSDNPEPGFSLSIELTSGSIFLRNAARAHFADHYENPVMYIGKKLHRDLRWTPALRFVVYGHINVFVEPSEDGPYPRILSLKYADVQNFPEPISVYAICPENMIASISQRADMKELKAHGFGLITVDDNGQATRLFAATPLVQVISRAEFKAEIQGLSKTIRQRLSEAFESYQNQPVNGMKSVTSLHEETWEMGRQIFSMRFMTSSNSRVFEPRLVVSDHI